jgi:hypothetical protein
MKNKTPRTNWWLLYVLVILVLTAFFFEAKAPLTENGHRIAQIAILLPGFGLIYLWLSMNEGGLTPEDMQKQRAIQHQSLKQTLEGARTNPTARVQNDKPPRSLQALLGNVFSVISGFFHF